MRGGRRRQARPHLLRTRRRVQLRVRHSRRNREEGPQPPRDAPRLGAHAREALHVQGHDGAVEPRRQLHEVARARQGRQGDADTEAPLPVLADDACVPQARRSRDSRDEPAKEP